MNKRIIRIAEEYADMMHPERKTFDDNVLWGEYCTVASKVLSKLSKEYVFVPKARVMDAYAKTYPHDYDRGISSIVCEGILKYIFGGELFDEV